MSNINTISSKVNLLFQGGYVEVSLETDNPAPVGGKRGVVNEFSSASRRRLMGLIAKLEPQKTIFLTLTYPAEFPSPRQAKKDLKKMLQRLQRDAPSMSAIWRLEFQKRGAPHFHVLLFNFPYVPKQFIEQDWAQVIGQRAFTRIEMIRDRRKLMNYVSKYVAKVGASEASSGFNLSAYLHVGNFIHPQTGEVCGSIGRWWGIFNANSLPLAEATLLAVQGSLRAFYSFRRAARHRWSGVGGHPHRGFKLFVDDACRWFDLWLYCLFE